MSVIKGIVYNADERLISTIPVSEPLTVGGRLILPHVPAILQYLSKTTISAEKVKKKKNRAQVSKELGILSK